jgi:predicted LPLAT superfamily acyltransferase
VTEPAAKIEQWQQRPEGGGRFALWLLRTLAFRVGRPTARLIAWFTALYFMIRRGPERAASRAYLHRIFGRRATIFQVFKHFLYFSTVTLDRLYLMADRFSRFDVEVNGIRQLDDALALGKGTLLLGAHLGSFDTLRVMSLRNPDVPISILLDMGQGAGITQLLNALNPKLASTIIDARRPGQDLVLEMHKAFQKHSVVATLADRMRPGNVAILANFLGAPAPFPVSPWLLASALHVPVVLAFGLHHGGNRYSLHFERFECEMPRDRQLRDAALADVVQRFAGRLEHFARLAPYNWFNLYDFWDATRAKISAPVRVDDKHGGIRPGA